MDGIDSWLQAVGALICAHCLQTAISSLDDNLFQDLGDHAPPGGL